MSGLPPPCGARGNYGDLAVARLRRAEAGNRTVILLVGSTEEGRGDSLICANEPVFARSARAHNRLGGVIGWMIATAPRRSTSYGRPGAGLASTGSTNRRSPTASHFSLVIFVEARAAFGAPTPPPRPRTQFYVAYSSTARLASYPS